VLGHAALGGGEGGCGEQENGGVANRAESHLAALLRFLFV
jgi:hypothetical protein